MLSYSDQGWYWEIFKCMWLRIEKWIFVRVILNRFCLYVMAGLAGYSFFCFSRRGRWKGQQRLETFCLCQCVNHFIDWLRTRRHGSIAWLSDHRDWYWFIGKKCWDGRLERLEICMMWKNKTMKDVLFLALVGWKEFLIIGLRKSWTNESQWWWIMHDYHFVRSV